MAMWNFIKKLTKQIIDDEILFIAGELTYKIVMALFPFIIFLMAILGFLSIDANFLFEKIADYVPPDISKLLDAFVLEVVDTRNVQLLSGSLLVTLYSTSSGFNAMIRGINKAYGYKETRKFLRRRLLSLALVLFFVLGIVLSLVLLIFENKIIELIGRYVAISIEMSKLLSTTGVLIATFLILTLTVVINKFASCKKIRFSDTLPGSLFTVAMWIAASWAFNLYVNHFSNYSRVYGSIAGVFILLLWLNIISMVLLIGSEINGLFMESRGEENRQAEG